MTVTMLPSAGEYANHKGELFETDGTVYNVCGTECYLLRGYGLFAIDQLEVMANEHERRDACNAR